MNLYRVEFDTSDYPFFVLDHEETGALRRAILALENYGSANAKKTTIEKLCGSVSHLVLDALGEKDE